MIFLVSFLFGFRDSFCQIGALLLVVIYLSEALATASLVPYETSLASLSQELARLKAVADLMSMYMLISNGWTIDTMPTITDSTLSVFSFVVIVVESVYVCVCVCVCMCVCVCVCVCVDVDMQLVTTPPFLRFSRKRQTYYRRMYACTLCTCMIIQSRVLSTSLKDSLSV